MAGRVRSGAQATEPRPPTKRFPSKKPSKPPSPGTYTATSVTPKPPKPKSNNNASDGKPNKGRGGGSNSASAAANDEIRAGINDARKTRRVVRREASTARRAAVGDYKRSLGDLDYIYGETKDYMGAMGNQIHDIYSQASTRAESAQAALVQQLQAQSGQVGGALSSELSRLGLQGVDNSQFASDSLNAVNMANQVGANNQANIGLQQSGADAISSLLQGMATGSQASAYGTAQNVLNTNLYDIYQNKREGYTKVAEAIADLRGQRKDLTRQQMDQLSRGHWGRYVRRGDYPGGYSDSYHASSGSSGSSDGASAPSSVGLNDYLLSGITGKPPTNQSKKPPKKKPRK